MPAKGTRKLTDQQKVEIVIGKQTKPNRTDTYRKLASDLDVSEITVRKTTLESLTERQRHVYEETVKKLRFSSLSLTANSLEKANELVGRASETKDLAGVVAAGKFGHEVFRLESGQSTANIGDATIPDLQCKKFIVNVLSVVFPTCEDCGWWKTGATICGNCNGKVIQRRASHLQAYEALGRAKLDGVDDGFKARFVEEGIRRLGKST